MGKHKYIETPEKMWEIFLEYVSATKARYRIIEKATPRGIVQEKHTPPLTIEGFKNFCFEHYGDVQRYFNNRDNDFTEYAPIITRIKEYIRQDQIEGGMIGQYNSNLTARLNGLADKREVEEKGEPRVFKIVRKGLAEE